MVSYSVGSVKSISTCHINMYATNEFFQMNVFQYNHHRCIHQFSYIVKWLFNDVWCQMFSKNNVYSCNSRRGCRFCRTPKGIQYWLLQVITVICVMMVIYVTNNNAQLVTVDTGGGGGGDGGDGSRSASSGQSWHHCHNTPLSVYCSHQEQQQHPHTSSHQHHQFQEAHHSQQPQQHHQQERRAASMIINHYYRYNSPFLHQTDNWPLQKRDSDNTRYKQLFYPKPANSNTVTTKHQQSTRSMWPSAKHNNHSMC